MAACLWAGEASAVSFAPAAALWGIEGFAQTSIEISTTANLKPRERDMVVHRMDENLLRDVTTIDGIPVTSIRRTLLDLAGAKHRRTEIALDRALRKELTSLGQMCLFYEQEWTRGRRGIAILRELLVHRIPGVAPTDSDLELDMLRLIEKAGLPRPVTQYPVTVGGAMMHLDLAYPQIKLAIECDGYAWHSDREASDRDKARDLLLQTAGWRVVRFGWTQIHLEAERSIASLRILLAPLPAA